MSAPAAILLHPADNILVCCRAVAAGERVVAEATDITAADAIDLGHKIARRALAAGEKVIKYGAPIGSMTAAAAEGAWVHLHNMKSDYIGAHTRDAAGGTS